MIKLFSEKVVDTFTSSDLNIIQVENFEEIFFDVYEIEINGSKYIAEKVGDYHGSPVVNVPLVEGSNKLEAPFILRKGEFEVYYNPRNSQFLETINEEVSHDLELPVIVEEIKEEPIVIAEKKDKVLEDINIAKKKAIEEAQKVKERLLKEAVDEIKVKNDLIKKEVEDIKRDLINEFYNETVNAKEELSSYNEKKERELTEFVKLIVKDKVKALQDKVNTTSDLSKANLTKDIGQLAESLKLTINSREENLSQNVLNLVKEEFGKAVKVIDRAIDKKSKLLDTKLYNQVQRQRNELLALEKANVELNDTINKTNNKALSRIGNVKKDLELSLEKAEERVREYYDTRIKAIEESIFKGSKDEILNIIRKSRESILEEFLNVKEDIPAIAEARSNVNTLKEDIEKSISKKFTNEMQTIKRLIEMSSGGGSVAMQFADGGTMNGNLDVNGSILSGGVDIVDIFTGGSGTLTGTGTVGTVPLWESENGLTDSRITQSGQTVTVSGNIVLGDVPSWQLTVGAEAEFNSQFVVNSNAFMEAIIPNDTVTYDLGSGNRYWRNLYLSGGVYGDVDFNGDITGGNATFNTISALSGYFTQTVVSTTSALSIINDGTGPALYVQQDGSEPIAHFIDKNGDDIVFADNGYVGIGTFNPDEKLTVVGNISSTGFTATSAIYLDLIDTKIENVLPGQMVWNPDEYTFDLGLTDDVTLQVGQEQLMLVKGGVDETIRNGMAVYAGGQVGTSANIQISAFSSNSSFVDELYFIGLATQEFINEQEGFVNTFGRVREVDGREYSSGGIREDGSPEWNVGQILYPSTSLTARGTLTTVTPIAPNREMPIAWVTAKPNETNMTLMVRAEHGYHLDEIHNVKYDGDLEDGQTLTYNSSLSVWENSSNVNTVSSDVITITDRVDGLYSYLVQNFDSNTVTTATSIIDFVNNYPKTGITTGDVITLSATNEAYLLGNSDGSSVSHWYEVNLKPNFIFYKIGLDDYSILDTFPLSGAKSAKYIIQVEDRSDDSIFYGEVNVVSDGTIAVASEYGLNYTTVLPFVEFGAVVQNGTHVSLSAIPLEGKTMSDFIFKGNRANLFG